MGVQAYVYSLRLEPQNMAKLRVTAKKNGRSVNKEIEIIVQQYLEKYEQENGPIKVEAPKGE